MMNIEVHEYGQSYKPTAQLPRPSGQWRRVTLGTKYREPGTEPNLSRTEPNLPKPKNSIPYSVSSFQEPNLPR
jgi:hypothetical protein